MSYLDDLAATLRDLDAAAGWDRDDNKPAIPKIPRPRPPQDDHVQCSGCPDTVPRREIREHAGWPLCLECIGEAQQRDDRDTTRQLAYTLARAA